MNSKADDAHRLQEIADRFHDDRMPQADAWSAVIDVVAGRLGCGRVSLWKFEGERSSVSLHCIASKATGGVLETGGHRLTAADAGSLRAIVNKLAMLMVRGGDRCLWDSPSLPLREFELAQGAPSR